MIFTMLVSLFTSRVVMNVLGVDDYGINNVVAGVVFMFSFLTNTLSAAISRFLTYELGTGYLKRLKSIFSTSVNVLLVIAILVSVLIEILGVWFLNTKLNIPESRMYAANWVMQFAILSFVINLLNVPYNSAIIAHEKMGVFAFFSVFEVIVKLIVVYLLYISPFDKLISYSALFLFVLLLVSIGYRIYCVRNFKECKYSFVFDKTLLKEMGGFAGWNLFGSAAYIFNTQGVNLVTNLFFGVAVNAGRGVAAQVEGVVRQFVTNFTTALNPQITKSYASGDLDYMNTLVCRGAKYSFLLMLFFTVPICYEADIVLKLWLKMVPEYASIFVRLTLIGTMFDLLGNSLANACWATGKVKKYYLYVATWGCLPFFLSWLFFSLGYPPYSSYLIFIVVYGVLVFIKLYLIKGLMDFPIKKFVNEVILKISYVTLFAVIPPGIIWCLMPQSISRFFIISFVSIGAIVVSVYSFGLEHSERELVLKKISKLR